MSKVYKENPIRLRSRKLMIVYEFKFGVLELKKTLMSKFNIRDDKEFRYMIRSNKLINGKDECIVILEFNDKCDILSKHLNLVVDHKIIVGKCWGFNNNDIYMMYFFKTKKSNLLGDCFLSNFPEEHINHFTEKYCETVGESAENKQSFSEKNRLRVINKERVVEDEGSVVEKNKPGASDVNKERKLSLAAKNNLASGLPPIDQKKRDRVVEYVESTIEYLKSGNMRKIN